MRVLDLRQVEVFLPVRPLFLQGRRTVTDLDPTGRLVRAEPRVPHVPEVLALGDRTFAESSGLDCPQEGGLAAGLHSCPDEIPHRTIVPQDWSSARPQCT